MKPLENCVMLFHTYDGQELLISKFPTEIKMYCPYRISNTTSPLYKIVTKLSLFSGARKCYLGMSLTKTSEIIFCINVSVITSIILNQVLQNLVALCIYIFTLLLRRASQKGPFKDCWVLIQLSGWLISHRHSSCSTFC